MDANETSGTGKRFWSRRKLVVLIASVVAVILMAGLVVRLNASRNELITELPKHQSQFSYQISRAWQRVEKALFGPTPNLDVTFYSVTDPNALALGAGKPVLTNEAGVSVWILDAAKTKVAMATRSFENFPSQHSFAQGMTWGAIGDFPDQLHFAHMFHSRKEADLALLVGPQWIMTGPPGGPPTGSRIQTNTSVKPFGARITVPNGSSVLFLGPRDEPGRAGRFCRLVVTQ